MRGDHDVSRDDPLPLCPEPDGVHTVPKCGVGHGPGLVARVGGHGPEQRVLRSWFSSEGLKEVALARLNSGCVQLLLGGSVPFADEARSPLPLKALEVPPAKAAQLLTPKARGDKYEDDGVVLEPFD